MIIIFSNDKVFEYTEAFAVGKDHYNGETRPSIEVHMPVAQTTFDEISSIVNNADAVQSFMLMGEEDANGNRPSNIYEGYVFGDRITVENGMLIFKKYKASPAEMENTELKAAVDTLLIAMEV